MGETNHEEIKRTMHHYARTMGRFQAGKRKERLISFPFLSIVNGLLTIFGHSVIRVLLYLYSWDFQKNTYARQPNTQNFQGR